MAKWNAVNGAIKYTLNIYEIGVSEPIKTSEIEVGTDFPFALTIPLTVYV